MEYFKIVDENQKDVFINLENVLWIECSDKDGTINFFRGEDDSVPFSFGKEKYLQTKEKLIRVLTSSSRVVLD